MPISFDDTDVERVRSAVDIAEIIGDYVNLKRRGGADYWGTCPFHTEKTASFHVRSDRGMFHCFGCGKGGNVFTFLMEIERLTFPEAVQRLAERVNIQLTERRSSKTGQMRSQVERLTAVNSFAARFFHERLTSKDKSADARRALEYLEARGIDSEIIRRYSIGWAENNWDALVNAALRNGLDNEILVTAGLALKRRDGKGLVDRFRGRVIFPVIALSGKPVAFGGRRIEGLTPDDDIAKYVNSPDTPIYRKGDHLYGLFNARIEIRIEQTAYLVEGYTDLIAMNRAGVTNAVASLGTALTEQQAHLLRRFCQTVIVVYDGDDAGIAAALRAGSILILAGLESRFVLLPQGGDPDSHLRQQGHESLMKLLTNSRSLVEYHLQSENVNSESPQNVVLNAVRNLLKTIATLRDPLIRDMLLNQISEKTAISRSTLDATITKDKFTENSPAAVSKTEQNTLVIPDDQKSEHNILENMLAFPELASEAIKKLTAESFDHPQLRRIFSEIERRIVNSKSIDASSLANSFDDPAIINFIAKAALLRDSILPESAQQAINECAAKINRRELDKQDAQLRKEIIEAQSSGKSTTELTRKLVNIKKILREIDKS